jgi:hypothetical protein
VVLIAGMNEIWKGAISVSSQSMKLNRLDIRYVLCNISAANSIIPSLQIFICFRVCK